MKVTNFGLVGMLNQLNKYSERKLPQKISYAITRNIILATNEYKIYETQLNKLMEEYSDDMVKDESGNLKINDAGIPEVNDSVKAEYFDKLAELLNLEIELNIYTIDESVFDYDDDDKYDSLSPKEIINLQSILCANTDM